MRPYLFSSLSLLFAILLSVAIGAVFLPFNEIIAAIKGNGTDLANNILFNIRLPRTILVIFTGMALGGSGAAYQGLFRNPLADPFLIGIASGAGLGAVIAMSIDWSYSFWGLMAIPIFAFVFALLTVIIVYFLARVGQTTPITNLLLAGVAVSAFATSLMSFLMLRTDGELRRAMSWLMGGSIQLGWNFIFTIFPYLLISLSILVLYGNKINVLQFGDEQAQQLGLDVTKTKRIILICASLATASAVAFSGIIGFIGLIVPHLTRLWFGSDYRHLLPLSIISGATVLLVSDVIARIVLSPQELPVGIVTALAGAPFFLWILRNSKTQGLW